MIVTSTLQLSLDRRQRPVRSSLQEARGEFSQCEHYPLLQVMTCCIMFSASYVEKTIRNSPVAVHITALLGSF